MKTVRVRLFAAFREAAGADTLSIDTDAATLEALFRDVAARCEGLQHEPAALVAVNDEMADWSAAFESGDEVLFFPPVAGG